VSQPDRQFIATAYHFDSDSLLVYKEAVRRQLDRILVNLDGSTNLGQHIEIWRPDTEVEAQFHIFIGVTDPFINIRVRYQPGEGPGDRSQKQDERYEPYLWVGIRTSGHQNTADQTVTGPLGGSTANPNIPSLHVIEPPNEDFRDEDPFQSCMSTNQEPVGFNWISLEFPDYYYDWTEKVFDNPETLPETDLLFTLDQQEAFGVSARGLIAPAWAFVNSPNFMPPQAVRDDEGLWCYSIYLDPSEPINFDDFDEWEQAPWSCGDTVLVQTFNDYTLRPEGVRPSEVVGGNYEIYANVYNGICEDDTCLTEVRVILGKSAWQVFESTDGEGEASPPFRSRVSILDLELTAVGDSCNNVRIAQNPRNISLGGDRDPSVTEFGFYGPNTGGPGYFQGAILANVETGDMSVVTGASDDQPLFQPPYFDKGAPADLYESYGTCSDLDECGPACDPSDPLSNLFVAVNTQGVPGWYPVCWEISGGIIVDSRAAALWQLARVVNVNPGEGNTICYVQLVGDDFGGLQCSNPKPFGYGAVAQATGVQTFVPGGTVLQEDGGFSVGQLVCVVGWSNRCVTSVGSASLFYLVTPAVQTGFNFSSLFYSLLRCPLSAAYQQYVAGLKADGLARIDGPPLAFQDSVVNGVFTLTL